MGLVTAHRDGNIRPETSGQPLPGAELVLSEEGEILVKNVGMFVDYYKNSDAYAAKFVNGWYQSGDYGYIDEAGHLIVIDRMEDLRSLKGGKKFSPQYPEVRLRFSPYIKEVLVVGGEDRDAACDRLSEALQNMRCDGISTTIPMHLAVLSSGEFRANRYDTRAVPGWES